jgi:hypothetical protein
MHIQAVLRGVGREKTRRQQKSVSLFLYVLDEIRSAGSFQILGLLRGQDQLVLSVYGPCIACFQ